MYHEVDLRPAGGGIIAADRVRPGHWRLRRIGGADLLRVERPRVFGTGRGEEDLHVVIGVRELCTHQIGALKGQPGHLRADPLHFDDGGLARGTILRGHEIS